MHECGLDEVLCEAAIAHDEVRGTGSLQLVALHQLVQAGDVAALDTAHRFPFRSVALLVNVEDPLQVLSAAALQSCCPPASGAPVHLRRHARRSAPQANAGDAIQSCRVMSAA